MIKAILILTLGFWCVFFADASILVEVVQDPNDTSVYWKNEKILEIQKNRYLIFRATPANDHWIGHVNRPADLGCIDAVHIATPAEMHAQMSMDSMLAGKHVGVEAPASYKLQEC